MASPFDSVNAPNPASYSAPNLAALLYQGIGGLPQDYFQGTQQGRTLQQQNLFKNGLPTDANGQPDINAISQALIKTGGAEQAQALLPFLFKQQFLAQENAGDQQPVNRAPTTGQSPDVLTRAAGGGGAQGITQTNGGDTLNSLAGDHGVNLDDFLAKYPGFKPLLNRDLTPDQAKTVTSRMQAFKGGGSGPISSGEITQGNEQVGSGGGPVGGVGGAPISPAPTAAAGGDTFNQRFSAATGGAAGMVPPGADPRSYAEALKKRAEAIRRQGDVRGIVGIPSKAKEDQALALDKQADAILEQLGKAGELTTEQKNARDAGVAGFEARKKVTEADIEQSKKKYDGLQNLGQVGQIGNQKLDRIRAVMSDPNFMSGAGHGIAQAFKQWSVTLGGDPKAAQPMEEFNKTAQQLLTDDIKAMGQSGAGPVRVAEVQIMKQATANLGISPATNRYLVEEAYRVHNDNIAVARLAQQYKQQHGYLDAGWDRVRDKYYEDHPLFSKEELADPRLVSPPMVPREIAADPAKRAVWEKQQGLKSGDPIRTDDGKIRWVR